MPPTIDPRVLAAEQLLQLNRPADARQTLAPLPVDYRVLTLIAMSWLAEGLPQQAVPPLRAALALRPRDAAALGNLGAALLAAGEAAAAVTLLAEATARHPSVAGLHFNHGNALLAAGSAGAACAAFRRAVTLAPAQAEAWINLGAAALQLDDTDAARAAFAQALTLDPRSAPAHFNLGVALERSGSPAGAIEHYRATLALAPGHVEAALNLAECLSGRGQAAEAERLLAVAAPAQRDARLWVALGNCRQDAGRPGQALDAYAQALALAPEHREARFNMALCRLAAGDLAAGWHDYELRAGFDAGAQPAPGGVPRWDGSAARGERLVVLCEQGLGDAIQFVRFGAVLAERGIRARLACEPRLVRLLSGAAQFRSVVPFADAWNEPASAWISLLSLPALLGTTLATVPASVPYLAPDPARASRWRQRLAALRDGPSPASRLVGIAWQGNPAAERSTASRGRSPPLAAFASLAALPGVALLALQRGPGREQLDAPGWRDRLLLADEPLDEGPDAFADTAALIPALDLVISCDTSIAHLAGALGAPVWVALKAVPDWRWFRERADSPWYPTMRLFRQPRPGDWDSVFAAIAAELARPVAGRDAASSPG